MTSEEGPFDAVTMVELVEHLDPAVVDVTIREVDIAPVQIQGPKAKEVMRDLFGPDVPEIPYYDMALGLKLDGMDVEAVLRDPGARTGSLDDVEHFRFSRGSSSPKPPSSRGSSSPEPPAR